MRQRLLSGIYIIFVSQWVFTYERGAVRYHHWPYDTYVMQRSVQLDLVEWLTSVKHLV